MRVTNQSGIRSSVMRSDLISVAARKFETVFGRRPTNAALAPGRVNLIGEHTDYNDGFALPMAIDRHTVVHAARSKGGVTTLIAADLNEQVEIDIRNPSHEKSRGFAAYVQGVAAQFEARSELPQLDLLITGDVPRASGLSSSASLEVAVAMLLKHMIGVDATALEIALLCQRAEREFVGVPCGVMDMYAIALGKAGHALLIDCRSLEYEAVPFPANQATLLIVDTGVQRTLRSGEYGKRRQVCEDAARALGVSALREVSREMIENSDLDDDHRRKAMHVVSENARVLDAVRALRSSNFAALGDLMFSSHASLRDWYEVSIDELNAVVDAAASLQSNGGGVFGARMTGAGFGGCAIVLCETEAGDAVARAISKSFNDRFGRTPTTFATHAVDGAQAIEL
jgi:galactokinase